MAAELGLGDVGPTASGGGDTEIVIGVTMKDGKPVQASIDAAGSLKSSLFTPGAAVPLGKDGSLGASTEGIVKGKATLELDLTIYANLDAFADTMQSTGLPILTDHGTPGYQDPVTAVKSLSNRFTQGGPREGATLTTQKFDGSTSDIDIGFFAGDLIAFGAGGSASTTALTATDAYYYDPEVGGMSQWRRCIK